MPRSKALQLRLVVSERHIRHLERLIGRSAQATYGCHAQGQGSLVRSLNVGTDHDADGARALAPVPFQSRFQASVPAKVKRSV